MDLPVTTRTLMLLNYRTVHIELSSKCVLKCPRCPRTELKLDRLNQEMTLTDFESGFPVDVLNQIELFIFCGDIGDPIYATEFLEIVEYIKQNSQARIKIVTNGSYKKATWWQQLGQQLDHNDQVTFSVDGWDNASNNLYRVNSDFDSIVEGITSLRGASECLIQWSMIYFSFNQERVREVQALAKSLGCNRFQTVKSSKFDGRYLSNNTDLLKPADSLVASTLVYELNVSQLNDTRYIPIVPLTPTRPHAWAKCLNYKKDLFIGIDGLVIPCPWFNNGYQHNAFVEQHQDQLSIRNRSFFDIVNDTALWDQLVDSFENSPLEICQLKCKNDQK
jgi:MoaA/NifB/PqqE/SkfB family radical SAM enzyme